MNASTILQLSPRGQITLPASTRRALGLRSGDPLLLSVEGGRVVLQPALVTPVEVYSDDRLQEFDREAELTPDELAQAKAKWGV